MAFYRPTKINNLFFASGEKDLGTGSGSGARPFHKEEKSGGQTGSASAADLNSGTGTSGHVAYHTHINHNRSDDDNNKRDHMTVRSVDEKYAPPEVTEAVDNGELVEININKLDYGEDVGNGDIVDMNMEEDEGVGGISNIPGFSSSEEKLLEYQPSSTSTVDGLLFEDEDASEVTDKYESITADIGRW